MPDLQQKEWTEIQDSTKALYAVLRAFKTAETGTLEALESVYQRLSLAVASATNRISGKEWECPLCGTTQASTITRTERKKNRKD